LRSVEALAGSCEPALGDIATVESRLGGRAREGENAALIRQGQLAEVDLEQVAEELESMGRSERQEWVNRLAVLLAHFWRAIRADLADLKREVVNNTLQIAALGQPVAGLTTAVYGGKSDFEEMKRRLERLERRLELREATP
jgi:hypothetical protein